MLFNEYALHLESLESFLICGSFETAHETFQLRIDS